nr:uncharacterized mitochondrial protein AtMg00810-like [Tanacetum cinerariifolium]
MYVNHQDLKIQTFLIEYTRGKIDKTLFIKRHKGDILIVQLYVDDIIFGSTRKELCNEFERLMHEKFQMSSMGELTFFLGLQVKKKNDGIFISQDKYVAEILKKFRFIEVKNASTPMKTQKPMLKDENREEVDVHMYRSMTGSLIYLTSSRPDIMFAVCACARYQVNLKVSHLHAMKRIFRYLKGHPKLGLWYLKDFPFDLVAYTDSDYARASLDRKSTTKAGSKNHPPMLNKENYVPWSSRLLRYAKSRPNGKLIHNSIVNGLYVRRMIPKPGDTNREVPMNETFHVQTDDELIEKELKQIETDDQAIQIILLDLPEDIYAAEKNAKLFNEWERFTSNDGESIESYYHQWSRHVTIVHQTKDLHTVNYTQLYDFLKYNQKENVRNLNGYNAVHNVDNQVIQNATRNPRVQNIGNQNGLIGVPGNANQNLNGNGNLVAARAKGNAAGHNGNQIRCYNYRGVGHFARNCTVRPRRKDAAYLQTQLLIAQKEEAGIKLQAEEFDLMVATADLDEIEKVNVNSILMANLQQASTSEEQYIELLEPIPESHQVPQNDNNVISEVTRVEQSGGTVEQHPVNIEETRVLYDSLYHNLAIEVEKVNTVNSKLKETKINALHLSFGKQIMTLNEEISDLNKQLSKEKSTVSLLLEEKKKLKSNFKIHEDELLDKQIQLEKRIKELDNILVKTGQSIQTIHMLSPKPDSFYHIEQKMALGYQNPFYLKQDRKKQQSLYDGKVLLEKHDTLVVHDSEETLQLAQ